MLVFIDESGDSGFRMDKGSTAIFAVAMVIFADSDHAREADQAICALREKWNVKPEFKFSKARNEVRDAFFECVRGLEFRVRALVVPKEQIYSGYLRSNKEAFYSFFVQRMIQFDNNRLRNARVTIDGSGERTFRRDLQTHLKKNSSPGAIKDIRLKDSKNDALVQMADMCVGAIARSYRDDKPDRNRWRAQLGSHIDDVWTFR